MNYGFFKPRTAKAAQCHLCGLYRSCLSPKLLPHGEGRKGILVVGEAPGATEDQHGVQFVGKAGQLLRETLEALDVDLDQDCWKTNALCCRPPENATPTDAQIGYCRPAVLAAIETHRPRVIVLLGLSAVKSVLGSISGLELGQMGMWAGWQIPSQRWRAWVCPTYHPSYVRREQDTDQGEVVKVWFKRHLEAVLTKLDQLIPADDPAASVEILTDPGQAAEVLQQFGRQGGTIAFDYETNMLKPDGDDARIVSCAVCWRGQRTIAYPWKSPAIEAMGRLLRTETLKVAANLKFEERWTRKVFGHGVRNWHWDTMQAAHVLDNRRGITGLKFQAFVRLGVEPYDAAVKGFLSSSGPRIPNRVESIPLKQLLLYNGLDALLEYRLAVLQMLDFVETYRQAEVAKPIAIEAKHLARTTDPATSKRAAEEIAGELGRLQSAALELIREYPGRTAKELTKLAGWDVWKRTKELERQGLIRVVGERECTVSGRMAQVLEAK